MVQVVGAEGKRSANMPGSLPAVEVMANGALFAAIGTITGVSTVVERERQWEPPKILCVHLH